MAAVALFGIVAAACGRPAAEVEKDAAPAEDPYPDDPANLEVWLERMEVGSREIYSARNAVAAAVSLPEGARIADIGAGTGIYSMLFSEKVGAKGAVFAVDIEPRFLKLINQRAEDDGRDNIISVLGRTDSITLPAASVDAVFICDTYHYFENPSAIMSTVLEALRPGGALYIVDYDVAPGETAPPDHRHVRFGKADLAAEIESFGFGRAVEIPVEGLTDNYMLRFGRP
ncbi:MAG: methyltransferase domain-containing protein [Parvularculaceae bacterium]